MREIQSVTVVGVGYIGLPTCVLLADAGYRVLGFDIHQKVVDCLNGGRILIDQPGLQELVSVNPPAGRLVSSTTIAPADAFVICVATPLRQTAEGPGADLTYVWAAAESVASALRPGSLVVLESTVPPGTTRRLTTLLSEKSGLSPEEFYTAPCPERVMPGNILRELRENDRIIGAATGTGLELACGVYARVLRGGKIQKTDDVTAEACKILENAYRDVNIAFANEVSVLSHKLGINVSELIALANCHPRVQIYTPGVGVGGHCIPVVPWFICDQFPGDSALMRTARAVNDAKPAWVADRVEEAAGRDRSKTLCVLGLTYKSDVDDLRDSPSFELIAALRQRGYRVIACEPNAPAGDVRGVENLPFPQALESDFLIVALAHREFRAAKEKIAARPHYDCVGLLYTP